MDIELCSSLIAPGYVNEVGLKKYKYSVVKDFKVSFHSHVAVAYKLVADFLGTNVC